MYNLAKNLSNSYSSVSLHAIKSIQKHMSSSSQGNILNKKSSLPSFPLLSFGRIIDKVVKRCVSHYSIHPEKLRQIIKANESQTLCKFFGSAEYQKRLQAIVENQKRLLSESAPAGIPESEIKYEHIISCAQPTTDTKQVAKNEEKVEEEQVITLLENKRKKKPVRTTIMSLILRKKKQEQEEILARRGESTIMPLVMQTRLRNLEMKKKFRRRSTILPIFLQKMKQIKEQNEADIPLSEDEILNNYYKCKKMAATKFNRHSDYGGTGGKYPQQLNDEDKEPSKPREGSTNADYCPDSNSFSKGCDVVSEKLAGSASRSSEKSHIQNLTEPTKIIVEDGQSNSQGLNQCRLYRNSESIDSLPEKKKGNRKPYWGQLMKKLKRSSKEKNRKQEVSQSCEMNLPKDANYEIDPSYADVIDVSHIRKTISSPSEELLKSPQDLFYRMKKGSKKSLAQPIDDEKYSKRLISTNFTEPIASRAPSLTYKTVCDMRERKKELLKDKFMVEVDFWKKNVFEMPRSINTKKKKTGKERGHSMSSLHDGEG